MASFPQYIPGIPASIIFFPSSVAYAGSNGIMHKENWFIQQDGLYHILGNITGEKMVWEFTKYEIRKFSISFSKQYAKDKLTKTTILE